MNNSKLGIIGLGVVIGLLLVFVIWQVTNQNYTYQGSMIDPPVKAKDFELTDQNGDPFRLSDQRGKVILIFFGYTHCPDVCPVTLSEFKQIKSQLRDDADKVEFIFITVDPERDTVNTLGEYISIFDSDFIALTGERGELIEVWSDYGVYQARQEVNSAGGYLVDHTARVFAIDIDGNWRLTYPFGMEREKIYQDIRHLIQEG